MSMSGAIHRLVNVGEHLDAARPVAPLRLADVRQAHYPSLGYLGPDIQPEPARHETYHLERPAGPWPRQDLQS